jgi:hypothetical protein
MAWPYTALYVVAWPPAFTLPVTFAVVAPVFETVPVLAENVPFGGGGHAA